MKNSCIDFYALLEQTHRSFLELVEHELSLIDADDLTPIQAIIMLNIGENDISLCDLVLKRGYSGSNASYNIKKMVSSGYVQQIPSPHDKRSLVLRLTNKGKVIFGKLRDSMDKHSQKFEQLIKDRVNHHRATKFLRETSNLWRNSSNDW